MKAQCWCMISLLLHTCLSRPTVKDQSIRGYLTERICWWNEVCKEEFQSLFRCKCPQWSFCRAPGRYYNAQCSMTETGYIWTQPDRDWSLSPPPNVNLSRLT